MSMMTKSTQNKNQSSFMCCFSHYIFDNKITKKNCLTKINPINVFFKKYVWSMYTNENIHK